MDSINESNRGLGNAIRFGTVAELDAGLARCRIQSGDMLSDFVPWLVPRAGETIEWSAPSIGEQVVMLCPEGDTNGAVVLRGIYSDAFPAPSSRPASHMVRFRDGALIHYDHDQHVLTVDLGSGIAKVVCDSALVEAARNVTIDTLAVNCTGSVVAEENIHAGNGATGSFITPTGATVTVQDGIVTNIF